MEVNEWMVLLGIVAIFSGIFSVLCAIALTYFRDFRISRLEKAVDTMYHANASASSINARKEKAERMQTAMVEVAAIMKNPEIQDKQKAIMELAMKYPDLVGELIRKGI